MSKRVHPLSQPDLFGRKVAGMDDVERRDEVVTGTSVEAGASRFEDEVAAPEDGGQTELRDAVDAPDSGTRRRSRAGASGPGTTKSSAKVASAGGEAARGDRGNGRPPRAKARLARDEGAPTKAAAHAGGGSGREDTRYFSVQRVARRYDTSVSTIWRWVKSERFPAPQKIAAGTTRWFIADLEAFDANLRNPG